jgi:phosphatidylglycerophosphatase A
MVFETTALEQKARELLEERGVTIRDIADLVFFLQKDYIEKLDIELCIHSVNRVLTKREVHNAIITGIELDKLAEQKSWIILYKTSLKRMKAFMESMKSWLCRSSTFMVLSASQIMAISIK